MSVRCTVRDRSGSEFDVVATFTDDATGIDLTKALRYAGVDAGTVRIDDRPVAPTIPVREHPLTHGSIVDAAGDRRQWLPADGAHLVVVSGPEAGAWYPIQPGRPLRVGRADGEVRLDDTMLSKRHVQVEFDGHRARVTDLESLNGTFVEGVRISEPCIVEPNTYVRAGASTLTVVVVGTADRAVLGNAQDGTYPFPRAFRQATQPLPAAYRLPRPLSNPGAAAATWWRALIPVVSGIGFALVMNNLRFLLLAALAPIFYAVDAIVQRRKRTVDFEEQRRAHHDESVATRRTMAETTNEERRRLRAANPTGGVAALFASVRHRRLWERRPGDADYMSITVGLATRPSTAVLVDQSGDDPRPQHRPMWGTPVNVNLASTGSVAVLGPVDRSRAVVRSMLLGLAVTHAPSDVTLWLFTEPGTEHTWGGVRWLPHAMEGDETCRIATTEQDRNTMLASLRQVLGGRRERRKGSDDTVEAPAHVVVFDGSGIIPTGDLSEVLDHGRDVGIYGIVIDPSVAPDGTMGTLRVGDASDEATFASRVEPLIANVLTAEMPTAWFDGGARRLAALRPSVSDGNVLSASSARLADVISLATTTPESLAARWQATGPTTTVQVGTTSDAPFTLDVVKQGPHGLVGGVTRSGKTEFLKTFVTALAWANHPDDLNFIVVDFKGGVDYTVAKLLPHVIDFSSNQDLGSFERTLSMLSAELKRRQARFEEVEASNLNAYREARARNPSLPPIPRLIVLVDEFAEMRESDVGQGQLKRLESMSRVGAGLGVHQFLITQKFGAKLPEQIEANAGLRVCFRVEKAEDSREVIGTSIAATIPSWAPGRAYARLQGADPVEFQSARVAGRRPELLGVERAVTLRAQPFATLRTAFASAEPVDVPAPETDMFAIIETINAAVVASGRTSPAVPWPKRLPDELGLDRVLAGQTPGEIPIGLADHPDIQEQIPFALSTVSDHVAILGGPRADLNGVLTTVACSAAVSHAPDDLHILGIDFAGRGLARIAKLPHCGAVASRSETLAMRIGKYLVDEMGTRRAELSMAGAGTLAELEQRTGRTFPHLLVLVAGAEKLSSVASYDEPSPAAEPLTKVIAEGGGLGIQMIAAGLPAFGAYKPGAYIDHRLLLTASDVGDYVNFGCPRALLGELGGPLRAIDVRSKSAVQICTLAGGGLSEADALDGIVYRLGERWPPERIERPPKVIREVTWPTPLTSVAHSLGDPPARAHRPVPVALDNHSGETVWIDPPDVGRSMFVAGGRRSGRTNTLVAIGLLARQLGWHVIATAGSEKSPLFDDDCPLDAVTLRDVPSALGDRATDALVVIDDADRLDQAEPSTLPESIGDAVLYVLSGPTAWFNGMQRALTDLGVPRATAGVVLVPESYADIELLGVAGSAARDNLVFDRRPGQGLLTADGDIVDVTVPLVDRRAVGASTTARALT